VCRWNARHGWRALEERYKFALDFIPIRGLNEELCPCKVARVQTGIVSRLLLGNPGTKSHSDVGAAERRGEYYIGEGGGFPRIQAVVSLMSPESPVPCRALKVLQKVN
jgi:hypothetical protein